VLSEQANRQDCVNTSARFVKVFAGTIFLSGGGGPGQRGNGTVEIQSGSVVTKQIALGFSAGCHSTLRIVGSKATGIVAEDGLSIGVYNYLDLEKEPPPSGTELILDIDAEGVTPIFAWGKTEGRVSFPVPDDKGNGLGTCRLQINLLAAPPSGDILVIGSANPCHGAFTGLAEGGAMRTEFDGKTYEWKLTYRGGRTAARGTTTSSPTCSAACRAGATLRCSATSGTTSSMTGAIPAVTATCAP
jgi:hypothetical protein